MVTPVYRLKSASVAVVLFATFTTFSACKKSSDSGGDDTEASAPQQNLPPANTETATLPGKITVSGTLPAAKPAPKASFPECARAAKAEDPSLRIKDGAVQDVFVYIKQGLPAGQYPMPEPVTLDQKG